VLGSTALASTAVAQAPFKINSLAIGGTGCPDGSFSTRSSAQGGEQQLTIRFRDFDVQGGSPVLVDGKRRADTNFATCNVAANITPAPGFQIALVDVDIRGNVDVQGRRDTELGLNNVARIEREYFFNEPGALGDADTLRATRIVNSDGNYSISDNFAFLTYARCNQSVLARTRLTLSVAGRNNFASIRVLDEEADSIRLGFRVRRCDSGPTVIPIGSSETVTNACVLEGDGAARRKVCYDRSGKQISNTND
jgi:hypothetical protein